MSDKDARRYRFGPLERRGLIGSLRPTQVVVAAVSLASAVFLLRTLGSSTGVAAAIAIILIAAAFCFWPVAGRSAEEWLPIVARQAAGRARGHSRHRSAAPQAGVRILDEEAGRPEAVVALPAACDGLEILSVPVGGEQVGVIVDRKAHTFTAALAVKVTSFGLLDRSEQEARQAGWGSVLAGLGRQGSAVSRIQWIERTVPADGDEIGRYLGEAWNQGAVALDSIPMQSYLDLASNAPGVTKDHELFVCLQVDVKRAWRQMKRSGDTDGPEAGACAVLLRELEGLAERLSAADVQVVGALRPGMLASAIRIAYDPWTRPGLARLAAADPDRDGIDEAAAWPVGADETWSTYRADGAFHATYWISSWPRTDVNATFLSPLLLHGHMARAIAVTIEPVSPLRAIREAEASRTTDLADQELRGRMGFVETARRRRLAEATVRREEELADGHAAVRFAGYVTVFGPNLEELDRGCSDIEHAAQMARLELLRLHGQQQEAFTYTLPLCRGLR